MTFPTPADYLDFWRPHPALRRRVDAEVEDYLTYDLDGDRSSVSLDAVRDDSAGLLDPDAAARRVRRRCRTGTVFLRAPSGMLGDPGGLYPAEAVEQHRPASRRSRARRAGHEPLHDRDGARPGPRRSPTPSTRSG